MALIEEKKPKSYNIAVGLLNDLRELAKYRGETEKCRKRVAEIHQIYPNRPALKKSLISVGLV